MATLIKKIFGDLSGSLGDNVFRSRYGKVVVYQKPSKHRISKSRAAKRSRKNFALIVALARTIISENELKTLWQKSNLPGTSAYHKIIKYNSAVISENDLTVYNKMIPDCNTNFILNVSLDKKTLNFYFNQSDIAGVNSLNIFITGYFYNKKYFFSKDYLLKSIKRKFKESEVVLINNLRIDLNEFLPNNFRDAVIFITVQLNKNDEVIYSTLNQKIKL